MGRHRLCISRKLTGALEMLNYPTHTHEHFLFSFYLFFVKKISVLFCSFWFFFSDLLAAARENILRRLVVHCSLLTYFASPHIVKLKKKINTYISRLVQGNDNW